MKTCVLIPVYNEEGSIAEVIKQVKVHDLQVVVVDDGSEDNTSGVALEHGAFVLRNERNIGKGASLIRGFDYILKNDFDAVITMDGDGQHLASDIPSFMVMAQELQSCMIVGNRLHCRQDMPLVRFLTNKFMSWFISRWSGQRISDTQCGFRLIRRKLLEQIRLHSRKYEIESELIIRASRKGFKIETVQVKSVYDGSKSNIRPFRDTVRFISFIVRETWITHP